MRPATDAAAIGISVSSNNSVETETLPRAAAVTDRAIDVFAAEIDGPRGRGNRDLDPGMPRLKFRHPRDQPMRGEGRNRRKPDLPAVALERLHRGFDALERVADAGEQPFAVFGESSRRPALRTSATPRLFSSSAIRCDSADRVTPNRSAASRRLPRLASSESAVSARAEGCAGLIHSGFRSIGEIISPIGSPGSS